MRAIFHFLAGFGLSALAVGTYTPASAVAPAGATALLMVTGDQHSAYERTAQLVAHVDRLRRENPMLPFAVLLDGDTLEYGNVVARRSAGEIDFAMFAALAHRAPTVLNLGNHEPEFYDVADTVRRISATGVTVISNIVDRTTNAAFAPASTRLRLGARESIVVGVTTDNLATFRLAVRPSLDLANPVVWARKNFPPLLASAPLAIVLSHAGVRADREMLPLVPDGTLFAGAHDHLRFVHREGRTVYVHSGSWNAFLTLAWLCPEAAGGATWQIEQLSLATDDPADPALAALIRDVQAKHLAPEDTAVIGRTPRALAPPEAARFAVEAVRRAVGADAALIGSTTFGAGLPGGEVTHVAFDACVRFDGTIFTGEMDGAALRALLATTNQSPDTPWSERRGEFLVAAGPAEVVSDRCYRIAVTDWVARNARNYLGTDAIVFTEQPAQHLKAIVAAALEPVPPARTGNN